MADTEHTSYLEQAIELANQGVDANSGGPFGAVVVLDGRVVGSGCNQVTSANDPTAHAEVVAIRAACRALGQFHLPGAILYASCEPCPMCLAAAYWAQVSAVYCACGAEAAARAGFDDAQMHAEFKRPVGERRVPLVELSVSDADEPFERWLRSTTKQEY
ncbi:MAG: nucleoside deaminase [Planctomycetota bacterium]|jgi:tRNA(Arg) A34 adenosine deaminase TadA